MPVDYRKLCKEIFHTDNEAEVRRIAKTLELKNSRNAGRKKKLTPDDIGNIKMQLAQGKKVEDIAREYGTSRQIITKSITVECDEAFPMQILYMYGNKICTIIYVDFAGEKIKIENRTDDIIYRAFGVNEKPTWQDFQIFLADRCFPQTRCGAKDIIRKLDLDSYDTLQIVEKTNGRMSDDNMYFRFKYLNGGAHRETV